MVISSQVYASKCDSLPSLKPSAALEPGLSDSYLFFFKEKIETIIP